MNLFEQVRYVYFLGIGGIGMSALARWFLSNGFVVGGYDREPSPLTKELSGMGASIHYHDAPEQIPSAFLANKNRTLVVFTPAIPDTHKEKQLLIERGFRLYKRAEVLGHITAPFQTLAVAGTHGKTTTSSLLTHMIHTSGMDMTAFVGGIMGNYGTNFIPNAHRNADTFAVVEADEFDRSFLHLRPYHSILTTAEADHLDIYGAPDKVIASFADFLSRSNPEGVIYAGKTVPDELLAQYPNVVRYGEGTAYSFHNIRRRGKYLLFDWELNGIALPEVPLFLPGIHNLENATAAAALALQVGVKPEHIRMAMRTYRGVKRRFEFILRHDTIVLIDDYAHHPTEVRAVLEAVRMLYGGRKVTAIFQPHLYSRTRDFYQGFAESLSLADEVVLLDIYPAREAPIEGVDSGLILANVKSSDKIWVHDTDLLPYVKSRAAGWEIVLTLGAGPIHQWLPTLKKELRKNNFSDTHE